jgi:hypothetical protein
LPGDFENRSYRGSYKTDVGVRDGLFHAAGLIGDGAQIKSLLQRTFGTAEAGNAPDAQTLLRGQSQGASHEADPYDGD